jgi:hypothetical protein
MLFAFEKDTNNTEDEETFEESLIKQFCEKNTDYEYGYFDNPPLIDNIIPVGSVKWCEKVYGKIIPNYYPDFMKAYFNRKIWQTDDIKKYEDIFIKPADSYKSWDGHIKTDEDNILSGSIWCSELVIFVNEWRYYIMDGNIVSSAWYDGNISDEDVLKGFSKPPPILPDDLLKKLKENNYCGILDMGEIDQEGKQLLTLVECCHPYAFGWYDENSSPSTYCDFLIKADKYMKNLKKK